MFKSQNPFGCPLLGLAESPLAIHAERRDTDENWGTPNDTWTQVAPSLAHDCDNAGTVI
jgi:hypothetical protein